MSPEPRRILVVDDEPGIQRIFKSALGNYGFVTEVAGNADDAMLCLERGSFDVVVTDVNMPGCDGIAFLRRCRERHADVPIIVMSGRPSDAVMSSALVAGAYRYLVKPVMPSALRHVIESAIRDQLAKPSS
jgi:DNA-binding NtrC family response regulator